MGEFMSTFIVPIDRTDAAAASLALGYQMAHALHTGIGVVLLDDVSTDGRDQAWASLNRLYPNVAQVDAFVLDAEPDQRLLDWITGLAQPVVVLQAQAPVAGDLQALAHWVTSRVGMTTSVLVGGNPKLANNLHRLLVALDGSSAAEAVLPLATQFALKSNATLGMVRIVPAHEHAPDISRIEQERDEARAYLDSVARSLRTRGVHTTWEVRIGDAGNEIARAAKTTAADLILMASQHYTGILGQQSDSVTETTIRSVNVPVAVVHVAADLIP